MIQTLSDAIRLLNAVEVAPERYAAQLGFDLEHPTRWYTAHAPTLIAIATEVADPESAVNADGAAEMPLWWRPTTRVAWRVYNCAGTDTFVSIMEPTREQREVSGQIEYITADLETGAEEPPSTAVTTLARGVAQLKAVRVAPERYAYPVRGKTYWRTTSEMVIDAYGSDHVHTRADHRDLRDLSVSMPEWWTPDAPFAYRLADRNGNELPKSMFNPARFPTDPKDVARNYRHLGYRTQRITADVETGAEVPA